MYIPDLYTLHYINVYYNLKAYALNGKVHFLVTFLFYRYKNTFSSQMTMMIKLKILLLNNYDSRFSTVPSPSLICDPAFSILKISFVNNIKQSSSGTRSSL